MGPHFLKGSTVELCDEQMTKINEHLIEKRLHFQQQLYH